MIRRAPSKKQMYAAWAAEVSKLYCDRAELRRRIANALAVLDWHWPADGADDILFAELHDTLTNPAPLSPHDGAPRHDEQRSRRDSTPRTHSVDELVPRVLTHVTVGDADDLVEAAATDVLDAHYSAEGDLHTPTSREIDELTTAVRRVLRDGAL